MSGGSSGQIPVFGKAHLSLTPDLTAFNEGVFILIDKPETWTSFDAVNKIRRLLKVKKAGHCGTLDPLATGLLIIATGKATKSIDTLTLQDKTYEAEVTLGIETDTWDADGKIMAEKRVPEIAESEWPGILKEWTGDIRQVPPAYSALKQNGVPLYKLARKGAEIKPEPRTVVIHSIGVNGWNPPFLRLTVRCGKGTYIRSLAHDIGKKLNCGAMLSQLRRTAIGDFSVEYAWNIPEFQSWLYTARVHYAVH